MDAVSKSLRRPVFRIGLWIAAGALLLPLLSAAQQLTNDKLSVSVNPQAGSYQLGARDSQPVLSARVGAQIDHQWLHSSEYPQCQPEPSTFTDELGLGHQLTVTCTGLEGKPDLAYVVQLYDKAP